MKLCSIASTITVLTDNSGHKRYLVVCAHTHAHAVLMTNTSTTSLAAAHSLMITAMHSSLLSLQSEKPLALHKLLSKYTLLAP